jgi:hypothetical protein
VTHFECKGHQLGIASPFYSAPGACIGAGFTVLRVYSPEAIATHHCISFLFMFPCYFNNKLLPRHHNQSFHSAYIICISTLHLCRNTGVGVTTSIGWIGSIVAPPLTTALLENCLQKEAVFVIVLVPFLAGVACAFFPVETKGRELE